MTSALKHPRLIERGELLEVGPHRIGCFDLEDGYPPPPIDVRLVYTDPPMTPALASGYRTKAHAADPTIERRSVDYFRLLRTALAYITTCQAPLFIEQGYTTLPPLDAAFKIADYTVHDRWQITYYRTKPCWLTLATPPGVDPPTSWPDLAGLDDEHTPGVVIEHCTNPVDWVVDPFTGQGGTALAAARRGRRFFGCELSPARASVAIGKLQPSRILREEQWH